MKNNDNNFIKIYNSNITVGSETKFSENELYIYCYLYTMRTYEDVVITNYEILSSHNKFYQKKTKNKKEIKNCIHSLTEKNLISVSDENKVLTINFLPTDEIGHVQIKYKKFRSFSNARDLYIYVAVSKWENKGGAMYSNNNWGALLNITREHAITVIEDACQREIIYKIRGSYTEELIGNRNQKKQEVNKYSIYLFTKENNIGQKEESKVNLDLIKTTPSTKNDNKVIGKKTNNKLELVELSPSNKTSGIDNNQEEHNWKTTNNLTVDDFVFYLENHNNLEIKEMCEERMKIILTVNPKFGYVKSALLSEAKKIIDGKRIKEDKKQDKEKSKKIQLLMIETDDIILQINNNLVLYKDFNGKVNEVEKLYYFERIDVSCEVGVDGAFANELKVIKNPKSIEKYRKVNGEWKRFFEFEDDEKIA